VALGGIVAIGAALRFATLDGRSLWVDEGWTVALAKLPLGEMLDKWHAHEDSPPLFYLLIWGWARLAGTGEVALRSFSALLGTATIPVAYGVTTRLSSRRAGLVAALLVAVSALDVWFSQDARSYALVVFVTGLSVWAFVRALDRPSSGALGGWAVISALALVSHYFAAFLVAAEALWLLAAHRPEWRRVASAAAVPALVLVALVPLALAQRTSSDPTAPFLSESNVWSRLVQIPAQYVVAFQPPAQILVSVLAFLAVPVAAWLVLAHTDALERRGAGLAAALGACALLGPLALATIPGLDYVLTRYTAAAFIPLVATVAIGIGARRAGALGAVALVWLVAFSVAIDLVTANRPKFGHDDWRAAARALGSASGPRAIVLTPDSGSIVLPVYAEGARVVKSAVRAAEVDVIGLPPPTRRIGKEPQPPRPPSPAPPSGFVPGGRREAKTFTLVRYRAARATRLSRSDLESLALARGDSPSVLLVPAGS
jgi:4-amino-4-deoxy-L-arabinose transferase-like glycosyltransferase